MASYCWGDRSIPHRIIDHTDDHTIVEIDGEPKQIPHSAIVGRIESGQRVRVLSSGGDWKPGVVLDGDRLVVRFDSGGEWEMFDTKWMAAINNKPPVIINTPAESIITEQSCHYCSSPSTLLCDGRIESRNFATCDRPLCREHAKHIGNSFYCNRAKPSKSWTDTVDLCPDCVQAQKPKTVPMPELEDYEEDELSMVEQFGLLEPLARGDRVRIVLAGPPLEHLTGVAGTVEAENPLGFVSVAVNGHGSKLFKREQLDLLEEENQPISVASAPSDKPETLENSLQPIAIDARVRHDRYWPNHTGIVREVRGETAWLWFRDGVPLYPSAIKLLHVVQ